MYIDVYMYMYMDLDMDMFLDVYMCVWSVSGKMVNAP